MSEIFFRILPMPNYIEMARTLGPYGVRGWIRIAPTGDEELLLSIKNWWFKGPLDREYRPLEIQGVKPHGSGLIAKWAGCDAPEEAVNWKGRIYVDRADFPEAPEGEFWTVDLIGCSVRNKEGVMLGTVSEVEDNGVQDILSVKGEKVSYLIPVVPAYVEEIDLKEKLITVDWQPDWV